MSADLPEIEVILQAEELQWERVMGDFGNDDYGIGGVCCFSGLVREFSGGKQLQSLCLEHYPQMAEKQLALIADKACERWQVRRLRIVHRYGELSPGDIIVMVVVASEHRGDAFDACRYVMDYLKVEAPFWKLEVFVDGTQSHVGEREQDLLEYRKWNAIG